MVPGHRIITDWWQVAGVAVLVGLCAMYLLAVVSQAKDDARRYYTRRLALFEAERDRLQDEAEARAAREIEAIAGPVA